MNHSPYPANCQVTPETKRPLEARPTPASERFYWSASRLRRILQCPRQFRFTYVDRLPTVPGAPMVMGRVLHEIICAAHAEQMETGGLPPIGRMLAEFETAWSLAADNVDLRYPESGPPADQYLPHGREMLRIFRNVCGEYEPPLAVELSFEVESEIVVRGKRRIVKLRGVVDRLDEVTLQNGDPGLVVVDYKSGRKKLYAADAEEEIQLTIYAFAMQELLGLPVVQVELLGLRNGETVSARRRPAQIDWFLKQILPYAQETMDRREFPACPGFWCRCCEFVAECDSEDGRCRSTHDHGGEANGTGSTDTNQPPSRH